MIINSQNDRNPLSVFELNMRTTSPVESINSYIQRTFPGQTNIFKFVDNLKLHETTKASDLFQLSINEISSKQLKMKRKEDQKRQNKINVLTEHLKSGEISAAIFLESMSVKKILPSTGTFFLNLSHMIFTYNIFSLPHTAFKWEKSRKKRAK